MFRLVSRTKKKINFFNTKDIIYRSILYKVYTYTLLSEKIDERIFAETNFSDPFRYYKINVLFYLDIG